MRSKDYRQSALASLKGNWIVAVIAGAIAMFLGGIEGFGVSYSFNIYLPTTPEMENGVEQAAKLVTEIPEEYIITLLISYAISLVFAAFMFVIGCGINIGYSRFNLDLASGNKPKIRTLFAHFGQLGVAVRARILVFLHVFVGFIFFIVPGVIALYQYSLVSQVIADNPGINAREALRESKRLMKGNKWRFFCLGVSFVGWSILSAFTFGIGYYLLVPYMQAAYAEFYLYAKRRAAFYA